jgi:cAMP phosphodiesterase
VGDLTLDELRKIERISLTHSHLDHICSVGFLADSVGASRTKPITVLGISQTLENLQNIFSII